MTRWIKVPNVAGDDLRRAHTCHALGSQMIVLGGYPPGEYVDPRVQCESNFIRVFDLSTEQVRLNSHSKVNKCGTKGQLQTVEDSVPEIYSIYTT